jgi:hypothetical protein
MLLKTLGVVGIAVFVLVERVPASDVVDVAASLIGRPYVWGAEGPDAFDCSGLTQYVYREFAIDLPRRAVSQSSVGDPIRRMQRGDLVFFSSDPRKTLVTHVGIYEGRGQMIEASKRFGRVRRSDLDDAYWADRFMFAKRITAVSGHPEAARERSGNDGGGSAPSGRRGDVRRAAVRALGELAGVLLRRPGR